jgi:methyl-accepting chemotaxis protein
VRFGSSRGEVRSLRKELADQASHHADKIQELLEVTIGKIETTGEKNVALVERMMKALGDFTAEVRKLRAQLFPVEPRRGGLE